MFFSFRRAISPVIAAILLIGLTVVAVVTLSITIFPLMEPTVSMDRVEVVFTTYNEFKIVNGNSKAITLTEVRTSFMLIATDLTIDAGAFWSYTAPEKVNNVTIVFGGSAYVFSR